MFLFNLFFTLISANSTYGQLFIAWRKHLHLIALSKAHTETLNKGLLEVLDNPKERVEFEAYLVSEYAVESLKYHREATKWERMYDFQEEAEDYQGTRYNLKRAQALSALFLREGAVMQINIQDAMRSSLINRIASGQLAVDMFHECNKDIVELMQSGPFLRFKLKHLRGQR